MIIIKPIAIQYKIIHNKNMKKVQEKIFIISNKKILKPKHKKNMKIWKIILIIINKSN